MYMITCTDCNDKLACNAFAPKISGPQLNIPAPTPEEPIDPVRHAPSRQPRHLRKPIDFTTRWVPTPLQRHGVCGILPDQTPLSIVRTATDPTLCAAATREEMRDARLPLAYRDSCAHLLIPLNKCRKETWYAPWKCSVSLTASNAWQRRGRRRQTGAYLLRQQGLCG